MNESRNQNNKTKEYIGTNWCGQFVIPETEVVACDVVVWLVVVVPVVEVPDVVDTGVVVVP